MAKIRFKVPVIILSAVVVTAFISGYSNYLTNVRLIQNTKQQQLKMVATLVQNKLVDQSNSAASKVALIIDRPDVKKAFREQNRDELIRITQPAFTIQKEKFGVRDAAFTVSPSLVFLRLHNPTLFGDDTSSYREMILLALKNKRAYQGIEIGRSGVSMRAIDVVEDDQGVIGTFELGMSFSTILEDIKKNTDFEAAVFINDELMTKVATSRPRASQERIFGDLQGIGATDWNKVLPNMSTSLLNRVNDITYINQRIKGIDYGVTLYPFHIAG